MKKILIKSISVILLLAACGCVALVFVGCQTAAKWEKRPETAVPIQKVVEVNGVQQLATVDYMLLGGGFSVEVRSPLWAKESLNGFLAEACTNGAFRVSLNTYDRDLSTNAVVLTKTIFDGSANLALAVAKAYATISTGGGVDATSAIVSKAVSYFKAKGGDASKSTVTSDGQKITVTDGSTSIQCDAEGNCSYCAGGSCSPL